MDKSQEERIGELLMLVGFLTVIIDILGIPFIHLKLQLLVIYGVMGFILFIIGAEIFLRSRRN